MSQRLTSFVVRLLMLVSGAMAGLAAMPADQPKRIAMVSGMSATSNAFVEMAFWSRMRQLGWVEGNNVVMVRRYADGKLDRLPALVADSLSGNVDVLVTPGTQATIAARKATTTIPIVAVMGDPVGARLVESLGRPGGNVTGVSIQTAEEVPSKWMELMREAVPDMTVIAVIVNPDNAISRTTLQRISQAETGIGIRHLVLNVRRAEDYANAIKEARRQAQAAIVVPDALSFHSRETIARLAEEAHLPILAWTNEFVIAGALMAYGPDEKLTWQRVAEYVDKILKGANPADLPIQQPTEFRLSINLRTAKALGITIPKSLLARADELVR